jgi:hypothetical protein
MLYCWKTKCGNICSFPSRKSLTSLLQTFSLRWSRMVFWECILGLASFKFKVYALYVLPFTIQTPKSILRRVSNLWFRLTLFELSDYWTRKNPFYCPSIMYGMHHSLKWTSFAIITGCRGKRLIYYRKRWRCAPSEYIFLFVTSWTLRHSCGGILGYVAISRSKKY